MSTALNLYYLLLRLEKKVGIMEYQHTVGAWNCIADMKLKFLSHWKNKIDLLVLEHPERENTLMLMSFSIATVMKYLENEI